MKKFRFEGLVISFLILAVFAAYGAVVYYDFLNFDDDMYVFANPHIRDGITWHGIQWAFSADLFYNSRNADYWQPVTILSRMIDIQLFGLNPAGHHVMNLLIHLLNSILLFLLFRNLTGSKKRSAFLAAVFALHPLQTEAVAWVTARKDVLCVFFEILTLGAYVKYVRKPSLSWKFVVMILFALALMSKPTAATLPFILLLLDFWPLGRVSAGSLRIKTLIERIFEKWPLFIFSLLRCIITWFGPSHRLIELSETRYLSNIFGHYGYYLVKTINPISLMSTSPVLQSHFSIMEIILASFAIIGISVFAVFQRKSRPYVLTGWLWFLVSLVPNIGLSPSGDRFAYWPLVGLLIAVIWGAHELFEKWRIEKKILISFSIAILLILTALTQAQASYWGNSETLSRHFLNVDPEDYQAHNNLGSLLLEQGKLDEAAQHFLNALTVKADYISALSNLGVIFLRKDKLDEAEARFREALKWDSQCVEAYCNLGIIMEKKENKKAAAEYYLKAIQIQPDFALAHNKLGVLLAIDGQFDGAISHLSEAVRIDPTNGCALHNLNAASINQSRTRKIGKK